MHKYPCWQRNFFPRMKYSLPQQDLRTKSIVNIGYIILPLTIQYLYMQENQGRRKPVKKYLFFADITHEDGKWKKIVFCNKRADTPIIGYLLDTFYLSTSHFWAIFQHPLERFHHDIVHFYRGITCKKIGVNMHGTRTRIAEQNFYHFSFLWVIPWFLQYEACFCR